MEIDYKYTRIRKTFGRQCLFHNDGPRLIEDVHPNKSLQEKYLFKNPVDKGVQVGFVQSENFVNTPLKDHADRGMNHLEGGWPKEIDPNDEEAVLRFRKKVERLDSYVAIMQRLTKPMEKAILQNNTVNIYEQYFSKKESAIPTIRESCRVQNNYRDPNVPQRPVTRCSFSPTGTQFCVAYSRTIFQGPVDKSNESYIWDIERPLEPLMACEALEGPIFTLEYNTRDHHWLVSGLHSGQIALFDIRKNRTPVGVSALEVSHRCPVHSVLWISSKTNVELFSTSTDGVIQWWDCRKLDNPLESIILDTSRTDKPSITRANPASCLEYEPSIPARYTVGTETGHVIGGNRKGMSHQEKLPWILKTQIGPIFSIHRNQGCLKNFLVVGQWCTKIWTEDCRESAIIWTKNHKATLTCGEWSPTRLSVFFLTREDGVLDLWDILVNQADPYLSLKLCEKPLTALRVKEDGMLVLVGNSDGTSSLIRFSENLAESGKNEKAFLTALFDREARREKILESRNREIKLKQREIHLAKETDAAKASEKEEKQKTEFEILVENTKQQYEAGYFAEIEPVLQKTERKKNAKKPEDVTENEVQMIQEENAP